MVKTDIVDRVYDIIGFTKIQAQDSVEMIFDFIKKSLAAGEEVSISGFGSFVILNKNERVGRNPKTGEEVMISKRSVVTFRPSKKFRKILDGEILIKS